MLQQGGKNYDGCNHDWSPGRELRTRQIICRFLRITGKTKGQIGGSKKMIVLGIIIAALAGYLVYALIYPEKL